MPRSFTSKVLTGKVLTGNALIQGDVIYRAPDGTWTRDMSAAELITDEGRAKLLLLQAETETAVIIGPYLIDAQSTPKGPAPTHFREEFRRTGPSNYAHGKQVEYI